MKARYTITCARCGYEWTGKKGSMQLYEFITDENEHYRLCENCIIEIGKAKTEEEKNKIIEEGKIVLNEH